jgi:hypothetical protein
MSAAAHAAKNIVIDQNRELFIRQYETVTKPALGAVCCASASSL